MVISKENKYIFVAVNKTGSTSIQKFLLENDKTATKDKVEMEGEIFKFSIHMTAAQIKKVLGKHYDNYTVFGFIRNPYSRVVSGYFFLREQGKATQKPLSFNQKLKIKFAEIIPFKLWALMQPYRSNKVYFVDKNEKLIVDKIGVFENISEDLETILIGCGLNFDFSNFPHRNKSSHKEESNYFKNRIFKKLMRLKLKKDLAFYESIEVANKQE